jgi:hypothetical protein
LVKRAGTMIKNRQKSKSNRQKKMSEQKITLNLKRAKTSELIIFRDQLTR